MMADPPKVPPATRLAQLEEAARSLTIPVLLIQGKLSDVVSDQGVAEFRRLVPHAGVVRLEGTAHTAAGDNNDAFAATVVRFCTGS
jgi:pimeloyl-ACP methyl ester carboxylesterase